jgi:hypothetical protein
MTAQTLNTVGLVLNIAGVIMVFFYGFPQPTHEQGVGIRLEDGTPLPDGKTVSEYDENVRRVRAKYQCISRVALALICFGFLFQLWATWRTA